MPDPESTWQRTRKKTRGGIILLCGLLAISAPFFAGPLTLFLGGFLLIISGVLEWIDSYYVPQSVSKSAYMSGELSVLSGILLLNVPELTLRAVALLMGISFAIDGLGRLAGAAKSRWKGDPWASALALGILNLALGLMLLTGWPSTSWHVVEILVGFRMVVTGWTILLGRHTAVAPEENTLDVHPNRLLQLPAHPLFTELNTALQQRDDARRPIDRTWCWIFLIVFFAIHVGRMRVYWDFVGALAPLVALVGDLVVTLVFAFGILLPVRLAWNWATRPLERMAWRQTLAQADANQQPGFWGRIKRAWLIRRLRFGRSVSDMRRAPRYALAWGLKSALPLTAVFIAIQPIWGFSWFFNSESWSSIIWDRWAEARTDTWRENMIVALREQYRDISEENLFQVEPPGITDGKDFSFLVIGDNGEGSPAQHSLRDKYLALGQRPDVKFMVISSDVIYPDGAMRDYEHNFYLPFKGFTKPIYGIPGNHDWYDALEGFAANFLTPKAARTCMMSRVETDGRLTSTTEARIERYLREGEELRKEYDVDTGLQRGPCFDIQTDRFALIAVDTGVLKTVDSAQWTWLKAVLARARGKFTMVLLGHPLYTAGHYQGDAEHLTGEWTPPYRSPLSPGETHPITTLHGLLQAHNVDVVMAGDMHLFEHCREKYMGSDGKSRTMQHFVNGGGGAYICVGVPFDWPKTPDAEAWTYYPRKDTIIKKLDAQTPLWKQPLWLWVKHKSGWPFSGYIMSAAFDHNTAPYFQSFVEIQVKNSKNEVCFLPHTARGRMRWRELEGFQSLLPPGLTGDDFVEFTAPMPQRGADLK